MENFLSSYVLTFSNLIWVNILLALLLVFFERRNPTSTWLWLMVLLFLPVVGFILYLFIGQDMRKKKKFKIKEEEDNYFDVIVADQEKTLSTKEFLKNNLGYRKYDEIIKLNLVGNKAIYTNDNDIELFFSGEDKFRALLNS
ncbi:MAG: cardiolipin synthase, partial [Tissierellia bacterium]|nr:cardiolipin synthase [Tissierellia bacterium]